MPNASHSSNAVLAPTPGTSLPVFTLDAVQPIVVGRADDCQVTVADSGLSRQHSTIWNQDDQWWIRDEESLNGTFLNGEKIDGSQLLDGDVIDFGGNASFTFQVRAAVAPRPADYRNTLFCLGFEPDDGGRPFLLRRRLSIVGRNKTADLVLDEPAVSGVHAKIEFRDGRVTLLDSGSKNGTVVNGETIRRSQLVPGDRVVFGGSSFTVKKTWMPSSRALTGLVSGMMVAVLAFLLPALFQSSTSQAEPLWTREMYLTQVTESLQLAVEAADAEPRVVEVAQAQFAIAGRSLVGADVLRPDRQTDEDLAEAFREAAENERVSRVLGGRDIFEIYRSLSEPVVEPEAEPEQETVVAEEVFDLDAELSRLVAQFGVDTRMRPIPPMMRQEVARFVEFWTTEKRGFTERALKRGQPHFEMIRGELQAAQLPEVFCYLPFIESGYQASITSSAKARGLWQFMPSTGRNHGLRVDGEIDERTDPLKSTQAACGYINSLLNMFGPNAFLCAVAAYNKGENGMARCLKKSGNWRSTWKFWDVVAAGDGCLRQETIDYVPRFLAAAVVLRRPEVFDLATD
jgi:pSer/pThr/pTyr-binding forkhead associated (FHA) protein